MRTDGRDLDAFISSHYLSLKYICVQPGLIGRAFRFRALFAEKDECEKGFCLRSIITTCCTFKFDAAREFEPLTPMIKGLLLIGRNCKLRKLACHRTFDGRCELPSLVGNPINGGCDKLQQRAAKIVLGGIEMTDRGGVVVAGSQNTGGDRRLPAACRKSGQVFLNRKQ